MEFNSDIYLLGGEGKHAENVTKEFAKCVSRTPASFKFCFLSQILKDPGLLFIVGNHRQLLCLLLIIDDVSSFSSLCWSPASAVTETSGVVFLSALEGRDQSLKLQFTMWVFYVGKDMVRWFKCTQKAAVYRISCFAHLLTSLIVRTGIFSPQF